MSSKRSNWRRPVRFDRASPVHKLAAYVAPEPAEALNLCSPTKSFDEALTELLDRVPPEAGLEDLTDAERAFCAGWAYLARRRFGNSGPDICNAIYQHINSNDQPGTLAADEDDVEVLNG